MIIMALVTSVAITIASSFYPATMEVVDVSNDVVTMETSSGNIYEMTGAEDYQVGDLVSLIMDNNGTEDITDDKIVSARYTGYWR